MSPCNAHCFWTIISAIKASKADLSLALSLAAENLYTIILSFVMVWYVVGQKSFGATWNKGQCFWLVIYNLWLTLTSSLILIWCVSFSSGFNIRLVGVHSKHRDIMGPYGLYFLFRVMEFLEIFVPICPDIDGWGVYDWHWVHSLIHYIFRGYWVSWVH